MLVQLGAGGVGTLRINLAVGNGAVEPGCPLRLEPLRPGGSRTQRVPGVSVLATVYSSPTWAEPRPRNTAVGLVATGLPGSSPERRLERYGAGGTFWEAWTRTSRSCRSPTGRSGTNRTRHSSGSLAPKCSAVPDAAASVSVRGQGRRPGRPDPARWALPYPDRRNQPWAASSASSTTAAARGQFDAVAIHPECEHPAHRARPRRRTSAGSLQTLRRPGHTDLDHGGRLGVARRPAGLVVGPAGQANYVTGTFELAAAQRDQLGIGGVIWYSLKDTPGPIWVGHCGLFRLDGSAKPAWEAFTKVASGSAS